MTIKLRTAHAILNVLRKNATLEDHILGIKMKIKNSAHIMICKMPGFPNEVPAE